MSLGILKCFVCFPLLSKRETAFRLVLLSAGYVSHLLLQQLFPL